MDSQVEQYEPTQSSKQGTPLSEKPNLGWKEFESLLKDLARKDEGYVALCAAFSLAKKLEMRSPTDTNERDLARAGSRLIGKITQGAIDSALKGRSFTQICENLKKQLYWYMVLIAIPSAVYSTGLPSKDEDGIAKVLLTLVKGGKLEGPESLAPVIEKAKIETNHIRRGVMAEFLSFCLFKQAGYSVNHAGAEDDYRGVDMYVDGCSVQIKSSPGRTRGGIFEAYYYPNSRFQRVVLVDVDVDRICKRPSFVNSLTSLGQSSESFQASYRNLVSQLRESFGLASEKYHSYNFGNTGN